MILLIFLVPANSIAHFRTFNLNISISSIEYCNPLMVRNLLRQMVDDKSRPLGIKDCWTPICNYNALQTQRQIPVEIVSGLKRWLGEEEKWKIEATRVNVKNRILSSSWNHQAPQNKPISLLFNQSDNPALPIRKHIDALLISLPPVALATIRTKRIGKLCGLVEYVLLAIISSKRSTL